MGLFRSALIKHPLLALAIGLAALALRLAVPAGFMPELDHGRVVLALCPGSGPAGGSAHHEEGGTEVQASCAFADLSLSMVGAAGPVAAAAAVLFFVVVALSLRSAPAAGPALRLRPPLRAPPAAH